MSMFRYGRWSCAPAFADNGSTSWPLYRRKRRREAVAEKTGMYSWNSGPMFGIRRPLRHLAWKLDLDESQVRELADILARLKTARSQARVDREASTTDVAQAFGTEGFDEERAGEALERRKASASAQEDSVLEALRRVHEILDEDQRAEFAYLLRSGHIEF